MGFIRFILEHNIFTFYDQIYQQKQGTAMGTGMAPQYANLFMHKLEKNFLATRSLLPDMYVHEVH